MRRSLWDWLKGLFGTPASPAQGRQAPTLGDQEHRAIAAFQKHYGLSFSNTDLLKLALTHRSYLSVTGQGPGDSNERLEFLGDSVLGLVTSEYLYRENPTEHEGQLTKTKSLLVSKAILSRRALAMGLGRFVLMSHSEVESGGRQRLSILADAFESVVGAIYLDQGFEAARTFIHRWLLRDSGEIVADKRHTNYKSHLQEYVQSTFHTHPVYRIRGELGPDHSKHFQVEVMVGKRVLGGGRGRNKKEAEQAAARDALEGLERGDATRRAERRRDRAEPQAGAAPAMAAPPPAAPMTEAAPAADDAFPRRTRRGRRGPRAEAAAPAAQAAPVAPAPTASPAPSPPAAEDYSDLIQTPPMLARIALKPDEEAPASVADEVEPLPPRHLEDDIEEIGRPEGPLEERHIDPYGVAPEPAPGTDEPEDVPAPEPASEAEAPFIVREAFVSEPPAPVAAGERDLEDSEATESRAAPPRDRADESAAEVPAFGRRTRRRR